MKMIQLMCGVEIVVTQVIFVNRVKIDVNLKESYQNGLEFNTSDHRDT